VKEVNSTDVSTKPKTVKERQEWEGEMSKKHGIELPDGHPYKDKTEKENK